MWLQLNAALRKAWRSTSSLQIGVGDVRACLDGLDECDDRLVAALADGIGDGGYYSLAARLGVPRTRAADLVRALDGSGVLVPPHRSGSRPPGQSGPVQAALTYGCHSDDLAADRAGRTVAVVGPAPVTSVVADGLVAAGVGRVRVEPDVPRDHRDLCVVVGHDLIHPILARDLLRRDQPHLAVVVTETGGSIGPLVVPGSTCCLRCVELYRRDTQPWWPVIASQLPGSFERAPVDAAVADALASMAALHAMTFLDGFARPASYSATVALSIVDGTTSTTPLLPYPECGCTWPVPAADRQSA
ncbi:TOMM precursor leader peptide-binding protein [Spelaeicoccus albus]|uniref:Bacteriocin biosynthesis cyclodehydratase domain-containing protein n=1 Tax=Spelaeicoccus albus TaxID=1280376 RepID=A0A7Z0D3E7_9MICO|nr:TOMM precursor leader peptide-binding protein [Spelaeicoccus albus]NYI68108.1 bacteriocin biosynthesis cyclodehydratase domain-containing protein [Spelaeicoccus albus]